MSAPLDHFETSEDGNIKSCPLAGWATMPIAGMALLVKLDYFPDHAAMTRFEPSSVQLAMTPEQCREFGQLLLRMADHLYQPAKSDATRN